MILLNRTLVNTNIISHIQISSGKKEKQFFYQRFEKDQILSYIKEHYKTLNDLPQIPEKHFAKLKHAHLSKVAFSKFLDSHEKDFWIICKIKFHFNKG